MTRPNLQWKGSVESENGVATLSAGEMYAIVPMLSCADAMKVQKLLDKAYIDGARDAQDSMRRQVENAIRECQNKW